MWCGWRRLVLAPTGLRTVVPTNGGHNANGDHNAEAPTSRGKAATNGGVSMDISGSAALVTGGAGFIGSNFVRYWLARHPDDNVLNLDVPAEVLVDDPEVE